MPTLLQVPTPATLAFRAAAAVYEREDRWQADRERNERARQRRVAENAARPVGEKLVACPCGETDAVEAGDPCMECYDEMH